MIIMPVSAASCQSQLPSESTSTLTLSGSGTVTYRETYAIWVEGACGTEHVPKKRSHPAVVACCPVSVGLSQLTAQANAPVTAPVEEVQHSSQNHSSIMRSSSSNSSSTGS
jgi:hypothetical protein